MASAAAQPYVVVPESESEKGSHFQRGKMLWLVAVSLLYRCYELTSGQFVGSLTSDEQPVVFLKSM